jgi:uncharacterized protein
MLKEPRIVASIIISAIVLVIGLALNSTFQKYVYRNRELSVTGSAKQVIISDLAKINLYVEAFAPTDAAAYTNNEAQMKQLLAELKRVGVADSSLSPTQKDIFPVFQTNSEGVQTQVLLGYTARRGVSISSRDVKQVQNVAATIQDLVRQGLRVSVSSPEYYYTQLGKVKVDIQSAAAADARERAKRIAEASGASLGSITSARMGVIQITPRNSVQVEDYGTNDVTTIEKEVTAVVSASFVLE